MIKSTREVNGNNIVISFGPSTIKEMEEWYDFEYKKSIASIKKIILGIASYTYHPYIICSCLSYSNNAVLIRHKLLNNLRNQGHNYSPVAESVNCYDSSLNLFSTILHLNEYTIDILFTNKTLIVFDVDDPHNIIKMIEKKRYEDMYRDIKNGKHTCIEFTDVGCDGNFITIYNYNNHEDLIYNIISKV